MSTTPTTAVGRLAQARGPGFAARWLTPADPEPAKARFKWTPAAARALRAGHAEGWSDRAIARHLGADQSTVTKRRIALGLPALHGRGTSWACRVRAHVAALRAAGWGWPVPGVPADLSPRAVRVLVLLLAGPATRQQLVAGLGMAWNAAHPSANLHAGPGRRNLLRELEAAGYLAVAGRKRAGEIIWGLTGPAREMLSAAASLRAAALLRRGRTGGG